MEIDDCPLAPQEGRFDYRHSIRGTYYTSFLNSRPPLITRVCRESRSVAYENGSIITSKNGPTRIPGYDNSLGNMWFCPETDIVHMNYNARREVEEGRRSPDPIPYLIEMAERGVGACITADFLYPFAKGGLWPACSTFEQLAKLEARREWLVVLKMDNLHLREEAVTKSGIFGFLGDEKIVLVDADDEEKLERLHELWEKAREYECDPTDFDSWPPYQGGVERWKYKVQSHWIRNFAIPQFYKKGGAGQPQTLKDEIRRDPRTYAEGAEFWGDGYDLDEMLDDMFFEEEHPFVKRVLAEKPIFKPVIMLRCCEECYRITDSDEISQVSEGTSNRSNEHDTETSPQDGEESSDESDSSTDSSGSSD
ncbi:hypothetical protein HYALB_00004164 [Hymenoscyphus albidus]|uniref:Uncharacterized protein n=1 Tax=Hymenoscyphus albidus TaxID=595503 RepID=A0A9N9QE21_9HELO|nr:hypothetical protein HYALB_00004164 [Hymenoscyphus albidus]